MRQTKNRAKLSKNTTVQTSTLKISILPYALAKISDSFHKASMDYQEKNIFPLVNYHLYLSAIEKGLKAAVLSIDPEQKEFLKDKVRHNLKRTYKIFKNCFREKLLTNRDLAIIDKVNKTYAKKGFEYFDDKMPYHALKGYSELPKIEEIKKLSKKVNSFLKKNNYFINSVN